PDSSTSPATSANSLSTQPPETEPASSPRSETPSLDPTGRGAEKRVATTVASAACSSPRSRQRSSAVMTSVTASILADAADLGTRRCIFVRFDQLEAETAERRSPTALAACEERAHNQRTAP